MFPAAESRNHSGIHCYSHCVFYKVLWTH